MVYMILGTGFEPMEAIAPCDILRRGGVEVQLAGIGGTLIEAGHGVRVQADCRVEDLKLASELLCVAVRLAVAEKLLQQKGLNAV